MWRQDMSQRPTPRAKLTGGGAGRHAVWSSTIWRVSPRPKGNLGRAANTAVLAEGERSSTIRPGVKACVIGG